MNSIRRSLTLGAAAALALAGTQARALPHAPAHRRGPAMPELDGDAARTMRDAMKADTRVKPAAAPTLPPMTAEQVVQRNAQARGGAQRWAAIQSIGFAGKLDAGRERRDGGAVASMTRSSRQAKHDARAEAIAAARAQRTNPDAGVIQLPYRAEFQRPARMRAEVDVQGQTAVQVWDGQNGWKLRPFLGRREVEPFSPEELAIARAQQQLDGALINHAAKHVKVDSDGTERVEGRDCYRLKLTLANGDQRRVWVDGKSFLEVRIEDGQRHFNGRLRAVYTVFRDYRPVQGLVVAHQLETRVDGVPQANRIFIEQVVLNPVLPASRFSRPV